jgi:hypothetical protein
MYLLLFVLFLYCVVYLYLFLFILQTSENSISVIIIIIIIIIIITDISQYYGTDNTDRDTRKILIKTGSTLSKYTFHTAHKYWPYKGQ